MNTFSTAKQTNIRDFKIPLSQILPSTGITPFRNAFKKRI